MAAGVMSTDALVNTRPILPRVSLNVKGNDVGDDKHRDDRIAGESRRRAQVPGDAQPRDYSQVRDGHLAIADHRFDETLERRKPLAVGFAGPQHPADPALGAIAGARTLVACRTCGYRS